MTRQLILLTCPSVKRLHKILRFGFYPLKEDIASKDKKQNWRKRERWIPSRQSLRLLTSVFPSSLTIPHLITNTTLRLTDILNPNGKPLSIHRCLLWLEEPLTLWLQAEVPGLLTQLCLVIIHRIFYMKEHDTSAWEKFSQSTNCLLSSIYKNIFTLPT